MADLEAKATSAHAPAHVRNAVRGMAGCMLASLLPYLDTLVGAVFGVKHPPPAPPSGAASVAPPPPQQQPPPAQSSFLPGQLTRALRSRLLALLHAEGAASLVHVRQMPTPAAPALASSTHAAPAPEPEPQVP